MPDTPRLDFFGMTDRGRVREANEDQFLIAELSKSMLVKQTSLSMEKESRAFGASQGHLLLVADGMGGHAAGERASTLAVESCSGYVLDFLPWFLRLDTRHGDDLFDELKGAVVRCHEKVRAAAAADPSRAGMGTTLTMAYLLWPRMYVVHVGDSRCYLVREGRLEQITRDHTIAQKLVEEGRLDPAEVDSSRYSHVLWNALGGTAKEIMPEVYRVVLEPGDAVVLCTDGLTKHVDSAELPGFLGEKTGAESTCRNLIDAANERGGTDNITVVVALFSETGGS